ncbi:MAG: hypothetical protein ACLQGP_15640 [Isosphaeraceae bacterium]
MNIQRSPSGWGLAVRQLFAVEPGCDIDLPGASLRRFESPTRGQVARIVAWVWRYPRSLLLNGSAPQSPNVIATYLSACKGRRMWATSGIFNAAAQWDAGLHAAAKRRAAEKREAKRTGA